jgi:type I restriction enzyme S subunit
VTLRVHPDEIVRASGSPLLAKHESWERVRLGEVAQVLNGYAFKSTDFSRDHGVPLLRIRDVGSSETQIRYVGDYDPTYLVERGKIVVGMDGDFRAARWNGSPALLNQRVCAITVRNSRFYDDSFLLHALPGYLDAIHHWTSSITVKHLSSETVKEIPLPLPPLAEQRRIVAAIEQELSRLEVAHASLARGRTRLAILKSAIFRHALSKEWPRDRLGKIATTTSGGTPSRKRADYFGGEIPWVKSGELRDGRVERTEETITHLGLRESSAKIFERGTLLVALYGATVGKLGVLDIDAATNQAVCAVMPENSVTVAYLWLVLRAKRAELIAAGQGGAQPNISQNILRRLEVPVPPLNEQHRVVTEVEHRVARVDAVSAELTAAEQRVHWLRYGIIARALRGELVPQDPNDEPANVLREGIAAGRAAASQPMRIRKERKLA